MKTIVHLEESNKRIVTLFDNDTEGIYAKELLLKELQKSNIDLDNKFNCIKILSYPNTKFLKKYPVFKTKTSSKSKIENDNINQRAAAIELYLPAKFLTDLTTGTPFPIRWKTYNEAVNKYQGSFQNSIKSEIIANFRKEKTKILNGDVPFKKDEWHNCDCIIQALFKELKIQEVKI